MQTNPLEFCVHYNCGKSERNFSEVRELRAAVAKCFWGFSTKFMKKWSYPAECAELSAHSEEKASSKQSLLLCSFPAALHLQRTKDNISDATSRYWKDTSEQDEQCANKTDWTNQRVGPEWIQTQWSDSLYHSLGALPLERAGWVACWGWSECICLRNHRGQTVSQENGTMETQQL